MTYNDKLKFTNTKGSQNKRSLMDECYTNSKIC